MLSIIDWEKRDYINNEPPIEDDLLLMIEDDHADKTERYIETGWYAGNDIYIHHGEVAYGVIMWAKMPKVAGTFVIPGRR